MWCDYHNQHECDPCRREFGPEQEEGILLQTTSARKRTIASENMTDRRR